MVSVPSIIFSFFTYADRTGKTFFEEAVAIVVSQLALLLGLVIGEKLILGRQVIHSPIRLLILYFFAGQFSSVSLILLLQIKFIAVGEGISAWVILTVGTFVHMAWLTIAHLALSLWQQNYSLIRELTTKTLQLEKLRTVAQGELSAELRALRDVVSEKIEQGLERIQLQVQQLSIKSAPMEFFESAKRIRDLSNQEVRQLSHQIAASDFSEVGLQSVRPDWRHTWAEALKVTGNAQLYWPWIAGIGSINGIGLALQRRGLPEIFTFVLGIAVGVVVLRLLDELRIVLVARASNLVKTASVFALFMVTSTGVTLAVDAIAEVVPGLSEYTNLLVYVVPVAVFFLWLMVFFITGFVQNFKTRAAELRHQSRLLELEIERARAATAAAKQKMSKVLHGTVQGRLASVSLALTAAANETSSKAAQKLLKQAKEQLDLTRDDLNSALWNFEDEEDVNAQLADLIASWESILDIDFKMTRAAAEFLNRREDIGQFVLAAHREAINNAARHSSSKSLSLEIAIAPEQDPEHVILTATNAAVGSTEREPWGLGINSLRSHAREVDFSVRQQVATLKVVWDVADFSANY